VLGHLVASGDVWVGVQQDLHGLSPVAREWQAKLARVVGDGSRLVPVVPHDVPMRKRSKPEHAALRCGRAPTRARTGRSQGLQETLLAA
jgi:hypothetical protein